MAEPVTAYLGLGGNLGDRLAALTQALQLLDSTSGICRTACSSIYETEPWGVTDQPSFLNLVAAFETTLEPANLLTVCKCVEATVGRTASYRWGPRLIDVDILLYGDRIVSVADPDLQIPHPRMTQRAFVLVPLAEIAADLTLPGSCASTQNLLEGTSGREGVIRWGPAPLR